MTRTDDITSEWLGGFIVGLVAGIILCTLMVFAYVIPGTNRSWEREAIEHNFAQYNSVTAEWEWNEPMYLEVEDGEEEG